MGIFQLPRAIADPQEVGRCVKVSRFLGCGFPLLSQSVLDSESGGGLRGFVVSWQGRPLQKAGEGLFVFEKQSLVGGEEIYGVELVGLVRPDGVQEPQHVGNRGRGFRIFCAQVQILDMTQGPVKRTVEIRNPVAEGCAGVVEGRGGVVVGLDHPLGVQFPLVGPEAVEDVAPEAANLFLLPVDDDGLGGLGPRLGILASHTGNSHDGLVGAPDEYQTHLQEELDFGLNGGLVAIAEQLRTVASMEEESLAFGDILKMRPKGNNLAWVDNGRETGKSCGCGLDGRGIRVRWRLVDGFCAPAGRSPALGLGLLGSHCVVREGFCRVA